ncbi:coat protein [Phlox virus S]|uniref:Capsid protein n=1 Tax=Phlox virus S TaxID=436066 RepID=A4ZWC9_9VIRU|nr:coat protein [Phlox virus S]ABP37860.1 coat protein [Phlox virus S]
MAPPKPDPTLENSVTGEQKQPIQLPTPRPTVDVDAVAEEVLGDVDRDLQHLVKLEELMRKKQRGVVVTNAGFETGRPPLKPSAEMRVDPTNIYSRPSTDFLWNVKPQFVSNNMATAEDMVGIKARLEGLGVPSESVTSVLLQLAIECAHTSSSSYQNPSGVFTWDGGAIMKDDVLGVVQEIAGLRRFCRLYAAITWNYMHIHKTPPADWSAMGFAFNTRYAAFDCFDYVENGAAIRPQGGIVPRPTPAEYIAYNTYKRIAIDKSNNNATFANLNTEVTGGRLGPEIERNFNNANNKRQ